MVGTAGSRHGGLAVTARSADDLLAQARRSQSGGSSRTSSRALAGRWRAGGRHPARRPAGREGELGFGLIVERNVLEWRFDLRGDHALPEVTGYDQPVVVVCSEGYASSLAAASLRHWASPRPATCRAATRPGGAGRRRRRATRRRRLGLNRRRNTPAPAGRHPFKLCEAATVPRRRGGPAAAGGRRPRAPAPGRAA